MPDEICMQARGDARREQESLERQARQAAENRALRHAMRQLAASDDGRTLLLYLLDESGLLKAAWQENQHYAAFLEGKRLMGTVLLKLAQEAGVLERIMVVKHG